jgi:hypothetical protein
MTAIFSVAKRISRIVAKDFFLWSIKITNFILIKVDKNQNLKKKLFQKTF